MEALTNILTNEDDNVHSALKCSICKKCLSVSPTVYNDIHGSVCGRKPCRDVVTTEGKNYEQSAYEAVAKYLKFPCMYRQEGCQEMLEWEDVAQHELLCSFKEIKCEMMVSEDQLCVWKGEINNYADHLEEKHGNKFLDYTNLKFSITELATIRAQYYTKVNENVVLISFYPSVNGHKEFFCDVFTTSKLMNKLTYQVGMLNDLGETSVILMNRKVNLISSKIFINNCSFQDCLKIDLLDMENFLHRPTSLSLSLDLNGIMLCNFEDVPSLVDNELLMTTSTEFYKCEECKKELWPPIFSCKCDQYFCADCDCTECHPEKKTRNLTVEKLFYFTSKPCKNASHGCKFSTTYPDIQNHQKTCKFRQCFMCSHQVSDIVKHLQQEHPFSSLNKILTFELRKTYIFLYDQHTFNVLSVVAENDLIIRVECVGTSKVMFKYQLELLDKTYEKVEVGLSFTQICPPEYIPKQHKEIFIPDTVIKNNFGSLRNINIRLSIARIFSN